MIYQIEKTDKYFDCNGVQQSIKVLSEAQARDRGFIPPLPKSKEQELHDTLATFPPHQIHTHMFLAGP